MKHALTISLLVNLLCAVVFVVLVRRDPALPSAPLPAVPAGVPEVESLVEAPPPVAVEAPSFHWSQLESTDYVVYRDNLREFGCPEWLVRQIVFRDLIARSRLRAVEVEKHIPRLGFQGGLRGAVEHPSPTMNLLQHVVFARHSYLAPAYLSGPDSANNIPTAWRSAAQIRRSRMEMAEQAYDNRMEVGRAMDALFGVFWLEQGWQAVLEPELGKSAMFGFLNDDHSATALSRAIGLGAFEELMMERTRGVYTDSDRATLRNHVRAELSRLTAELGPVASTELEARIGALLARANPRLGLGGLHDSVGGVDYRDLCLLFYELISPIEAAFGRVEEMRPPGPRPDREVVDAFLDLVEERLGDGHAAKLRRGIDPIFHATTSFAGAHGLHPSARNHIYETQRVLKLELAALAQRTDVSQEEKEAMRRSFLQETTTELSKVLAADQLERYLHGTPDKPSIVFQGREAR